MPNTYNHPMIHYAVGGGYYVGPLLQQAMVLNERELRLTRPGKPSADARAVWSNLAMLTNEDRVLCLLHGALPSELRNN